MRTTTTTKRRRRETRSKFEAEDGGATKLATENSDAFIHAPNSFLRVSYTSAVAVASAAAAAARHENQEITVKDEREMRRARERTCNQILSFSERREAALPGRNFAGAKSKLVFVHYSFARLRRRPN